MDEEIKENGEMATIEGEEDITIEEDYTTLEAETIIIDDDSNIQTDAEYNQAVAQKELADEAREALSAVLLSVLEKGEINDDDIAEIAAQQEIYTENVTALKILGLTTEDEKSTGGKSTTNVIASNIDYDELIKVLSEKADWLYIDEDGQVMLNGEVVPKIKVVELEAEKIKADVGEFKNLTTENFQAVNAKIDNLNVGDLTAINADIENLKANKADIEYLEANYATIENLNATNADIDNLKANKADINYLESNYATINLLNANVANINNALIDKANVSDLNATNANITDLQATKADITELNAANANIDTLTGNLADITTLVNGNLTSDNIQSINITGDKFTVADGFIKNAMIDSVSANKINTGTINTNNVKIQSADGSMVINGTTQQFKDKNNKVRIQIGKDAQGNFTFALFSQDGVGVLIDETGIKSGAVPNGLIVNDMVADGANISGSKLDINSVISSINNGTTTIKGTRIQLDEQGQSLEVAFNQLKTKVETIENISIEGDLSSVIEQVTSNTTSINTMQGQISSLISNTTITKANGEVVQLKDEYNSTKSTVNSHTTKIGSLETNLATANNNISSVTSKQASLEQNLNGFKQTVSDAYTTKADFNGLDIGGRNFLIGTKNAFTTAINTANSNNNFITNDPYTTYKSQTLSSLGFKVGDKITVSFDWSLSNVTTAGNFRVETIQDSTYKSLVSGPHNFGSNTSGRYVGTKTLTSTDIDINKIRIRVDASNLTMTIKNMKLEKGNKVTSWLPAPEDIDAAISTVDGKFTSYSTTSQMNSAINQKANEITSTVSETYATKASVTDVSNNLKNNYSTTSAMNSAINQKANEITSSVSSTYATKTSLKATDDKFANYSTTSQMNSAINQKANEITSSVSQTYATKTALKSTNDKFANYSTTTAMNTAINQKANSITQSVSNTYATKSSLETATDNITSLTNRMSSAESKLTKDSLTTTIGSYYTTSTDVNGLITNKGYATTSQVSQTATDLTAKFSSSGGYNLLRNSVFTRNGDFWDLRDSTIDTSRTFNGHNSIKITSSGATSDVWKGIQQRFAENIPKGKTYTASLWYYVADKSTFNSNFTLELKGKKAGATSEQALKATSVAASNLVQGAWTRLTVTATTSEAWQYLYIYPWVQKNGTIWITELQVEEGPLATLWTPHPYEAYDGITQISKDGIKVFHNSIDSNSYTHMSPTGFYIKNKGTDIFKVDTNGLYFKGKAEITSGSMPSSLLTGTIDNARLNSTIVNGATNGTSAKSTLDNKAFGWDSTKTAVDNNKTNWSNAYNRVVQWASGSVTGSTTINGGLIQTGTITAKQLYLGDLTNYCNLREETASLYGFTAKKIDDWGTWYKLNNNQRDICLSGNKVNDYGYYKCLGGESFRIKFEVKSNVKGSSTSGGSDSVYCGVNIGIYGKLGDGSNFYQVPSSGYKGNANSTEGHINVWTTLPANARTFGVFLQLDGWGNWSGTCYIKNVQVFRMSSGELIVDGSITADKIAANAITGKTITGGTINGSIFKSGTNYDPNKQNITGLQMLDDTIYSYGTKNNGMYAVTKISGGTINIGNGADGAGLNWSAHVTSSDISLFKQGSTGYFYVGTTNAPGSGYSTTTTTIDTNTINIGSKDVTTAFKVDYNSQCEFGNNYFTRGSLTINQLSQGAAKGTQTYLSGTTISATNIYQNGSSVSGSDIILKDNIKEYEDSALDIINKTKVYSFNRILANPDKTEIGFLAQQVPDIFVFDKGEFTAEELEGLTAQEKQKLLDKKTEEYRTVLENKKLDEIADNVASFYDLNDEQAEAQISQIMDEYKNIEYEVPISTINQNNIIGVMFKAIQELSNKVDELSK